MWAEFGSNNLLFVTDSGDDAQRGGLVYCLAATVDIELFIKIDSVSFNSAGGYEEFGGDLLVAQPPGKQGQNFSLPVRQGCWQGSII